MFRRAVRVPDCRAPHVLCFPTPHLPLFQSLLRCALRNSHQRKGKNSGDIDTSYMSNFLAKRNIYSGISAHLELTARPLLIRPETTRLLHDFALQELPHLLFLSLRLILY